MKRQKDKPAKMAGRLFGFGLIITILAVFFLKMYTIFKVDLLMNDLMALEQYRDRLISETETLRSDVTYLGNIDRISRLARKDFHLINNTDNVVILKIRESSDYLAKKKDSRKQKIRTDKSKNLTQNQKKN